MFKFKKESWMWDDNSIRELIRLHNLGYSFKSISLEIEFNEEEIYRKLKTLGRI
jgi:hypothetical protein